MVSFKLLITLGLRGAGTGMVSGDTPHLPSQLPLITLEDNLGSISNTHIPVYNSLLIFESTNRAHGTHTHRQNT